MSGHFSPPDREDFLSDSAFQEAIGLWQSLVERIDGVALEAAISAEEVAQQVMMKSELDTALTAMLMAAPDKSEEETVGNPTQQVCEAVRDGLEKQITMQMKSAMLASLSEAPASTEGSPATAISSALPELKKIGAPT